MSDNTESTGRHLKPVEKNATALAKYDPYQWASEESSNEEVIDLLVLWNAVRKRRWIVASVITVALCIGILQTMLTVPAYRSTAVIQINHDSARILRIEDFEATPRSWQGVEEFRQTQFEILRGRQLSEDVVRRLGIENHPELSGEIYQRSLSGELRMLPWRIRQALNRDASSDPMAGVDPERAREWAIRRAGSILRGRIQVAGRPNSRLVNISVSAFDPQFAAQLANAVAEEYMRSSMQRRYDAGQEARAFLEEQLDDMRIALERADQSLLDFAQQQRVADLSERIQMRTESLRNLNAQLTRAQGDLIQLRAFRELIDSGQGNQIRLVADDERIRALNTQRSSLALEQVSLSQRYQDDFPALVELRGRIAEIDQQIADRRRQIIDRVITDYRNLESEIRTLGRAIEEREGELLTLNQQGVQYNILRREFETSRELYDGMLQRLKEIGIAAGIQENNVALIDGALPVGRPYLPNTQRNIVMALAIGIALAVGLAVMLEFLDTTIRRVEDLEKLVRRPVIGLVPMVKQRDRASMSALSRGLADRAVSHYSELHPKSAVSEAFRSLRTSLMFSTPSGMPRTILVTSPGPGDGKTTNAINLATVMAQNGARVLLIDADLRKPRLHRDFGIPAAPGLSNRIAGADVAGSSSAIVATTVDGLFLMPSGSHAPNPAELLGSERMRKIIDMAARAFDHVIIDSAPILGLADALVLSRLVDGVIMVTSSGRTRKDNIKTSVRRLSQVQAPLLGVVLNQVDLDNPDYAYYSSYYYNYYNEGDSEEADARPAKAASSG